MSVPAEMYAALVAAGLGTAGAVGDAWRKADRAEQAVVLEEGDLGDRLDRIERKQDAILRTLGVDPDRDGPSYAEADLPGSDAAHDGRGGEHD